MRKKFIGKSDGVSMVNEKVYEVTSVEDDWYRIVCEDGESYLFPKELFVNEEASGYIDMTVAEYILEHLDVVIS